MTAEHVVYCYIKLEMPSLEVAPTPSATFSSVTLNFDLRM